MSAPGDGGPEGTPQHGEEPQGAPLTEGPVAPVVMSGWEQAPVWGSAAARRRVSAGKLSLLLLNLALLLVFVALTLLNVLYPVPSRAQTPAATPSPSITTPTSPATATPADDTAPATPTARSLPSPTATASTLPPLLPTATPIPPTPTPSPSPTPIPPSPTPCSLACGCFSSAAVEDFQAAAQADVAAVSALPSYIR